VDPTANLHSLHRHEDELRARSLEAVKNDPTLSNVSEAMNVIYAFAMTFRTIVTMNSRSSSSGKRLFNAGEARALGYYQKALDQVRGVLETYFLVDYLTTH
jgi:hypothetical protein